MTSVWALAALWLGLAEVATFLASDRAAGITGTMVNVTSDLVLR